MRIVYVLLSPTFGMHQYTADLANRMAQVDGYDVQLVTTASLRRDRYSSLVRIVTPVETHGTGFSPEGLDIRQLRTVASVIDDLKPDVVHITGVHMWNVPVVSWLARRDIPVIHTLHDLDPHTGVRFGQMIRLWNRLIVDSASHILVHGRIYRQRLLDAGLPPDRVTVTPLLHLFLSYAGFAQLEDRAVQYDPWALFFGRLEQYKGISHLFQAENVLSDRGIVVRLLLAGPGPLQAFHEGPLPANVEVRNRIIQDEEAVDLFRRCGLLILPYEDATQSALIAAAYYFSKPVLITRTGALPEYVQEGRTGWVVPHGDVQALADRIADALSDVDRLRTMGQAGRAWYDEQRSHEESQLHAMYSLVAQNRRDRGPLWMQTQTPW